MEMIGIVKRQAVIVLLFICFFPTMAVAQVSQFKLKQVLQDANAGDISACAYLGKMYYEGTGVAQNYIYLYQHLLVYHLLTPRIIVI